MEDHSWAKPKTNDHHDEDLVEDTEDDLAEDQDQAADEVVEDILDADNIA